MVELSFRMGSPQWRVLGEKFLACGLKLRRVRFLCPREREARGDVQQENPPNTAIHLNSQSLTTHRALPQEERVGLPWIALSMIIAALCLRDLLDVEQRVWYIACGRMQG